MEREVSEAHKNSDVHGLIEKIAYFYGTADKEGSRSMDDNWYLAQDTFIKWERHNKKRRYDSDCLVEDSTKNLLKKYASQRSKVIKSSSFDNWMYSQARLAQQIIGEVRNFSPATNNALSKNSIN